MNEDATDNTQDNTPEPQTAQEPQTTPEPQTAFEKNTEPTPQNGETGTGEKKEEDGTTGEASAEPVSAFGKNVNGETGEETVEEAMPETDEDWTKAVIGEGADEDITNFTNSIAPEMREAGVTPTAYSKIAGIVSAKLTALEESRKQERIQKANELSETAQKAFDTNGWKDIQTASEKYIKKDSSLYKALTQTELGSDIELLTILKTLGESARADQPPSNRASGPGTASLDHRMFVRSFPGSGTR